MGWILHKFPQLTEFDGPSSVKVFGEEGKQDGDIQINKQLFSSRRLPVWQPA